MNSTSTASIIQHFSSIPDPRIERGKRHELISIFFIAICAVICGANDWVAIETYRKAKKEWFVTSSAGAIGAMQLMPATAQQMS
jgi:hypothetical protein